MLEKDVSPWKENHSEDNFSNEMTLHICCYLLLYFVFCQILKCSQGRKPPEIVLVFNFKRAYKLKYKHHKVLSRTVNKISQCLFSACPGSRTQAKQHSTAYLRMAKCSYPLKHWLYPKCLLSLFPHLCQLLN